jgi:hypothetical protein
MDFTNLVRNPGVEEDPLGRGRLPGIDVSHDADVPGSIERRLTRHFFVFRLLSLGSGQRREPKAESLISYQR